MKDFNKIKSIYEQKKEKGYEFGLTYNDYKSIRKMIGTVKKMNPNDPEVIKLLNDMSEVLEIMVKNGGASKFSDENRDYINKHALLLPLVFKDYDRVNVDAIKDQPIIECYATGKKPITIKESSNTYLNRTVNHDRVEELYPEDDKKELTPVLYIGQKFNFKYNDCLEMLCRIYKFELPEIKSKFHSEIVLSDSRRYQETFKDPGLFEVLDYERELLEDNGYTNIDGIDLDKYFEERKQTIERVKAGEYDPNFKYEEHKRVFLYRK